MDNKPWFVYIVRCNDSSLYTGITNNLKERVDEHNSGEGAKYTRSRLPVKLVYAEKCADKSQARKWEMEIQGWPREKKLKLLAKGF
jgi:putative endonuclease